jgi:hypothetical protein
VKLLVQEPTIHLDKGFITSLYDMYANTMPSAVSEVSLLLFICKILLIGFLWNWPAQFHLSSFFSSLSVLQLSWLSANHYLYVLLQSVLLGEDIASASRKLKDLIAVYDSQEHRCIFEYIHLSPLKVRFMAQSWFYAEAFSNNTMQ